MSNQTMPRLSTATKPKKERLSLVLDFEKKQALSEIAQKQNRSLNFVVLEMIEKSLQEAKEEAQDQEYVKNRVLNSLHRLETEGSDGVPSEQVFDLVMERARKRLKNDK